MDLSISRSERSLLNNTFISAGVGFLMICVIGLISYYAMNATDLGHQINNSSTKDIYKYNDMSGSSLLTKLSLFSFALIVLSSILRLIWWFRIRTAGRAFITTTWVTYIIGQGFAFGFLFLTFKAAELFIIFAMVGGLFTTFALVGYRAKNLSHWWKYLFSGTMFIIGFSFLLFILSASGAVSFGAFGVGNYLWDALFFFSGVLTLLYITYVTWRVRTLSDQADFYGMDAEMRFKYTAFFGFFMMSEAVTLVWTIARFVSRSRN